MSKKLICKVCGCNDIDIMTSESVQNEDLYTYKCKACGSVTDMKVAFYKKQERLAKQRAEEQRVEEEQMRELEMAKRANNMGVAEQIYSECSGKILDITSSFGSNINFGTGFYISADGYILTNAHVVMQIDKGNKNTLDSIADTIDGKSIVTNSANTLELISADIENDIALLKADKNDLEYISLMQNEPKTGQEIYTIGNSKGEGMCILQGIISDASRKICGKSHIMFSAPVTAGNSGGPLIDMKGECIGMVVAKRKDTVAMNYAIPIEMIRTFLAKAIEDEELDLEI